MQNDATEQPPSFIVDPDNHVNIMFPDGLHETVYHSDERFPDLLEAVRTENWTHARAIIKREAVKLEETISRVDADGDRVTIKHGVVSVDGHDMHTTLTDRMLGMIDAGFDITPLTKFLTNLADNPSFRAVHELYDFLSASDLPITSDGHFLAYKRIRENYKDVHSGKMDNSIGAVVSMPRYQVNDDRDKTCSSGLHFCSKSYLSEFNGSRTVVVKINPADVVSIPSDYNNAKGRTCKYIVVQEINNVRDDTPTPLEALQVAEPVKVRKIAQIDPDSDRTIKFHESVEAAALDVGSRVPYIERVLSGERATTGGYKWKVVEEGSSEYNLTPATNQYSDDEFNTDVTNN